MLVPVSFEGLQRGRRGKGITEDRPPPRRRIDADGGATSCEGYVPKSWDLPA